MSDEKKYTERDLILAKREAFEDGARSQRVSCLEPSTARAEAAMRFPLPRRIVPRVVTDKWGVEWKFDADNSNARIMGRTGNMRGEWGALGRPPMDLLWIDASRVRLWADLVANPTEEIDDEG